MAKPDSKGWIKTCPNCRGTVEELARTCVHCGYDWDHPVLTNPKPSSPLGLLCLIYVLGMAVSVPAAILGGKFKSSEDAGVAMIVAPFYTVLGILAVASPVVFVLGLVGLFKSEKGSDKAFCLWAVLISAAVAVVGVFFANGIGALH
jgi:hypothetical protein